MLPTSAILELPELSPLFLGLVLLAVVGYSFLLWRLIVEYRKGKARDKEMWERVNRRAMIARMQLPEAQPPKEKK